MLGAIAGDILGAVCEVMLVKTTGFDLFPPCVRLTDVSGHFRPLFSMGKITLCYLTIEYG